MIEPIITLNLSAQWVAAINLVLDEAKKLLVAQEKYGTDGVYQRQAFHLRRILKLVVPNYASPEDVPLESLFYGRLINNKPKTYQAKLDELMNSDLAPTQAEEYAKLIKSFYELLL